MEPLHSLVLWNGCFAITAIIASLVPRLEIRWSWLFGAFFFFNANVALVLDFFDFNQHLYQWVGDPDLSFNWAGKVIAFFFSVSFLVLGLFRRQEVGLTLRQSKGSIIGWSVLVAICALGVVVGLILPNEPFSSEAILYQLTMPSFDEELAYRGIMMAFLIKAFDFRFANGRFGAVPAVIVSTIIFSIIHALFWTGDGLFFSLEAFIFAGIFGLLLAWLRLNTGSLLAPIFLHSAVNTIWRLF
jgi:membrane protease YdiL (CAAX protease family)